MTSRRLNQTLLGSPLRRTWAGVLVAVGAGALVLAITGTAALVPTAMPGNAPGELAIQLESTVADAAQLAAVAAELEANRAAGS